MHAAIFLASIYTRLSCPTKLLTVSFIAAANFIDYLDLNVIRYNIVCHLIRVPINLANWVKIAKLYPRMLQSVAM